ncbi:hypothetical protein MLD38_018586 [Melastoma candidum]|uniref:Uncharacterized protein n=1 Tax=Melastoma candidum TaxID=119954 RepID=A0ACB9QTH1_9MYRT|nr:hypothetical protein MLD38_018586 [Melastoma candidum]
MGRGGRRYRHISKRTHVQTRPSFQGKEYSEIDRIILGMGVISKHRCQCDLCSPSNESDGLSVDRPASPPPGVLSSIGKENIAATLPGSQPVPTHLGTAGGYQSQSLWTSDPAHFGFVRPTPHGSTPMPGHQSQGLVESTAAATTTPTPTHFSFPPQGFHLETLGPSSPAVTATPAPTSSFFGPARPPPYGSPMPGWHLQPLGKSNPTAAKTPSPAVYTFCPHSSSPMTGSQFQPPMKSNPAATTAGPFPATPNPSIANGQAHAVKDSCTHSLPQNNVFASSPASVFASSPASVFASAPTVFASSPASSFPNPSSVFPQQSPNGLFPERPGISPPVAGNPLQAPPASVTVAPIFSWTTLPAFGGSITCERASSFRPIGVHSEGESGAFHSTSAAALNKGRSHEELQWEHYQNNPMQGKIPVMMIPVIPLPGGGFSILTVQSNIVQHANTIPQATEAGSPSSFLHNN